MSVAIAARTRQTDFRWDIHSSLSFRILWVTERLYKT